ncbi:MAG: carboxylating nicotinate-nucleotide diphosphorylase [Vulcanimicrobiota bacterium]
MFELLYRDALQRFLLEDLGVEGDVTSKHLGLTDAIIARAGIRARQAGVVAGLLFVEPLCRLLDERCRVEERVEEGSAFEAGANLLTLSGPAPAVLAAERTALNLLSRTFGIATQVRGLVEKLQGTDCQLLPTRKTLPGMRFFDKYACETGGAARHRYGLNDAIMIKDNHLVVGGSLETVLCRLRESAGHMLTVEIECDTPGQLQEVLAADLAMLRSKPRSRGVDVVLLDNMRGEVLRECVDRIRAHPRIIVTEASGAITPDNIREVAESGVDFISLGALTHTVIPVDLGLDFDAGVSPPQF